MSVMVVEDVNPEGVVYQATRTTGHGWPDPGTALAYWRGRAGFVPYRNGRMFEQMPGFWVRVFFEDDGEAS